MARAWIEKIDCVRLSVPDLEAGLAFYRDRLGLRLIWRTGEALGLGLPGHVTEIVLHTEPQPPEIDLMVASADEAAGGEVIVPPFDIQIGRCAAGPFWEPADAAGCQQGAVGD